MLDECQRIDYNPQSLIVETKQTQLEARLDLDIESRIATVRARCSDTSTHMSAQNWSIKRRATRRALSSSSQQKQQRRLLAESARQDDESSGRSVGSTARLSTDKRRARGRERECWWTTISSESKTASKRASERTGAASWTVGSMLRRRATSGGEKWRREAKSEGESKRRSERRALASSRFSGLSRRRHSCN